MTKIQLAISTCPNDTFAFHAILNRCIDTQGLEFEVQLLDIQKLNDGLFQGKFDVAKASFHAALLLADETVVLSSGAALGFGVGPLLLASAADSRPDIRLPGDGMHFGTTLCPGQYTTATLLLKMFYGSQSEIRHVLFSDIMPSLQNGEADFGVCIHEGRFTWERQGLYLVEDLGTRWETETECPLPLGGILARQTLPPEIIQRAQTVIRDSIEYGLKNKDETRSTMKQYAQELDDEVLFQHVELYVNQWTIDLGTVGRKALHQFSSLAKQRQIVDSKVAELTIVDS